MTIEEIKDFLAKEIVQALMNDDDKYAEILNNTLELIREIEKKYS